MNRRNCRYCKTPYRPEKPGQPYCQEIDCKAQWALEQVQKQKEARSRALAKAERQQDKERREKLKGKSDRMQETQVACNAYIRYRDRNEVCIDCGKPFEPQKMGGTMDAGHYMSRALAPHLRFNELNIHGQRKNCNRPGGTTRAAFRAGMIARIGLEQVEALEREANESPKGFTEQDYIRIRDEFKAKLAKLKEAEA